MSTQRKHLESTDPAGDESEEASGPSPLHWGLLVLGAAMRRKRLAVALFLVTVTVLAAYLALRRPVYRVEASILVQPTPFARSSPEDPVRFAHALVHRRENLIDLINQTRLLNKESPKKNPPPGSPQAPSTGDSAPSSPAPSPSDDELNQLILRLDRALEVSAGDGTITIRIDWPDAQQAYRLVQAAQENFLEARQVQEISAIDEVISTLQGRAATMREQLEKVIDEVRRGAPRESAASTSTSPRTAATPRDSSARLARNEEIVSLKSMLDAKERAIADVEDFRRRRLADLQAQLDEKRGVYSEAHPALANLRQDIEALSRESPQTTALREQVRKLRREYAARVEEARAEGATIATSIARPVRAAEGTAVEQDERVRDARAQYQAVLDRLGTAQLDLDGARAAFGHRYNVTWPAEVPKKPLRPKPQKIAGGIVAALLLAVLAAAAPDLWSGRILQRWQVERALELPVLAELKRQ